MNVIEHSKYLWQIEDLISEEECDNFNLLFDELNLSPIHQFRNDVRKNHSFDLKHPDLKDIDDLAWSFISRAHKMYVLENEWIFYNWNKENLFGSDVTWDGKNIVRIYDPTDLYEWHTDHSSFNIPEFSYIVYLNDDYDGGETCFLHEEITVNPKKCSVICFPVDHYHVHKSNEIISGTKRIIWNCLYRQELKIVENQKFKSISGVPRGSKRSIW